MPTSYETVLWMHERYDKKRIHRSGADEGQGSALWQSRIDQHMRIVEDYICNIKPPFQNTSSSFSKYVFRIPIFSIVSRKWSSTDFPIQRRSDLPN